MLKLKLKEILLAQGKKSPQAWLQENCKLTRMKAYKLVNHKQKSIAYDDLSRICIALECTPDALFWWDNSKKLKVMEWHPLTTKLVKPDKEADWTKRIEGLNPERVEVLKNLMIKLETEKINETKAIFNEVKKRETEENNKNIIKEENSETKE